MSKIKVVQIAFDSSDGIYLVDNKGRVWVEKPAGYLLIEDVPEEPEPTEEEVEDRKKMELFLKMSSSKYNRYP